MKWIDNAIHNAEIKINKTLDKNLNGFPNYSEKNCWCLSPVTGWKNSYGDWTAGFWPGILWVLYEITKNTNYFNKATIFTNLLEDRLRFDSHDLGFLFFPSCVKSTSLSKRSKHYDWALQAATQLANRYDKKTKLITIHETNQTDSIAAIDTMMNLPLLWWAYRETANKELLAVAMQHAHSTHHNFLRSDGSTYHIIKSSKKSGEISWKGTWQGKDNQSCWSRGQAWALCGFLLAKSYSETDDFNEAIDRLFGFIIYHLPDDMVPYWDYDISDSDVKWKDSSAAAIMCYGLLQYCLECPSDENRVKYEQLGLKILHSLATIYSVTPLDSEPGLLRRGCFHAPKDFAVSACLVFGDYYYLEALLKARYLKYA